MANSIRLLASTLCRKFRIRFASLLLLVAMFILMRVGLHVLTEENLGVDLRNVDNAESWTAVPIRESSHPYHNTSRYSEDEFLNPSRICTQEERLSHLWSTCPRHPDMNQTIDRLNDTEVRALVREGFLVDMKHKVLGCLHFKSGSSTWRLIFSNNSAEDPIPQTRLKNIFNNLWFFHDYDVHLLQEEKFTVDEIRDILKTYYKFMVVRHPFTRLLSTYNDKYKKKNPWFAKLFGVKILNLFRPSASKKVRDQGFGVTFKELMQFINYGGEDGHWHGPFENWCQPCLLNYDRIIKLETHDHDAEYVIKNKLSGRGLSTNANSINKKQTLQTVLPEYKELDEEIFDQLLHHYHRDLEQFGYQYKWSAGGLKTSCSQRTESGDVCC